MAAARTAAFLAAWLMPLAASAGAGLFLSWNDCPLSAASANTLSAPCLNHAQEELVISFELPASADSVIALDATVDVESAGLTLPPWWAYAPAGCRYGQLTARAEFPGRSACADFWQGQATFGGPPVYSQGAPRGGSNQARVLVSFAVPPSRLFSLAAGTHYYAARLVFQNDTTGACAGCETPACLVLNSIRLIRPPGTAGGDILLETPGAPDSNRATWQSSQAECSAVPVRRATWGRLKALYR